MYAQAHGIRARLDDGDDPLLPHLFAQAVQRRLYRGRVMSEVIV
jgi:hypothetical protein